MGCDAVKVHRIDVGLSNAYLVEQTDGLLLVDTGLWWSAEPILRRMDEIGGELRLIYLTHAHVDHTGGAAALAEQTGAPVAIHEADAEDLATGRTRLGTIRNWARRSKALLPVVEPLLRVKPVAADIVLRDGDELAHWGAGRGTVVHTPGHTPGSTTLLVEDHAFVGDLASSANRPHAQAAYARSWPQLQASLERVQALQPENIYPGHGDRPLRGPEFQSLHVPYAGDA